MGEVQGGGVGGWGAHSKHWPGESQRRLRQLAHSPRSHADTSDGADATLQYYQPHSPLPSASITPLYKFTQLPPHQKQQHHSPQHRSRSTHHLDVNQAQHMLQLGQVVRPAMACIFPDLRRYIFPPSFTKNGHCLLPHSFQHMHTYCFAIDNNISSTTSDHSDTFANTSTSPA